MSKEILFVCLGNICRSPAAEAVMRTLASDSPEDFVFDSAGTSGYHQGQPSDSRMRQHAARRGYDITSIARRFNRDEDFDRFDLIVVMDDQNYLAVTQLAQNRDELDRVVKMIDFVKSRKLFKEIPDPYYSGDEGFDVVLDLLEDGCATLLAELTHKE